MENNRLLLPEVLFDFYRLSDKTRWRCELRDRDDFGAVVEFYRDDEFFESRRFSPWTDRGRSARDMAIDWAVEERKAIEGGR
jgi:hypothetical protein